MGGAGATIDMCDYRNLHGLIKTDPESAWPLVLTLLREHPESRASCLVEDFVYEHDTRFIDRIEAAAAADPAIRSAVIQAYVGGFATDGAERFRQLQERLMLYPKE